MLQRLLLSSLAPCGVTGPPPADQQRLLLMRPPGAEDLDAHWADFARHVRKMGCITLHLGVECPPPPRWLWGGCGALVLQILGAILVERPPPPCGCGALALERLRGSVVERPPGAEQAQAHQGHPRDAPGSSTGVLAHSLGAHRGRFRETCAKNGVHHPPQGEMGTI